MSVESFTSRREPIVAAFRKRGGHLTVAELAVPDVGGRWWLEELGAMRRLGYDLHEAIDGSWHLVDPKIQDAPAPEAFDFRAALRAVTARGRALDERRPEAAGDPRIAALGIVNGHEAAAPRRDQPFQCVHCGARWDDGLLTRACVRTTGVAA